MAAVLDIHEDGELSSSSSSSSEEESSVKKATTLKNNPTESSSKFPFITQQTLGNIRGLTSYIKNQHKCCLCPKTQRKVR